MKRRSLNGYFQIEDYNAQFLRVKMRVFAFDGNRNGSDIKREAFEKAKNTIFNIPIVGKFTEEVDKYGNDGDLEGHNSYLTTDKDGNWIVDADTYPIGVVSSEANITYEDVNEGTEEEPNYKTYVVVDNIYLWKRYAAVGKIEEWLSNGFEPQVSMEIGDVEGKFSKKSKLFEISSFKFEAICALGSEIEACFPLATIEAYSKQTFKDSFYEMLDELKQAFESKEGGKGVKIKNKNFSLSSEQLEDELRRELSEIETISDPYWDDYKCPRYSYMDTMPDQSIVIAYDCKESYLVGASYSVQADNVEIDTTTIQRYKVNGYTPMDLSNDPDGDESQLVSSEYANNRVKAKEAEMTGKFTVEKEKLTANYSQLEKDYEELDGKFSEVDGELKQRINLEREEAVTEVFEKFSEELSEADMLPIRENVETLTLEEIEERLFALAGRKKVKFSKTEKRIKMGLGSFSKEDPTKEDNVWA